MSLTAAGQAAYAHARRAIAAVEALEADVGAGGGDGRATLRVGVFQTAAAELLPTALRAFRREWPRVEVVLEENDTLDRLASTSAAAGSTSPSPATRPPTTRSRRSRSWMIRSSSSRATTARW